MDSQVGETDDILNPRKDCIITSTSPLEVWWDQQYFTLTEGPDSRRPHTDLSALLCSPFYLYISLSLSLPPPNPNPPLHKFESRQIGSKALQMHSFTPLQTSPLEEVRSLYLSLSRTHKKN